MEQRERMDMGLIYDPADRTIMEEQTSCLDAPYEYNMTRPSEQERRAGLLEKMLGAIGEGCYIEPPFHANWAGKHMLKSFGTYDILMPNNRETLAMAERKLPPDRSEPKTVLPANKTHLESEV